MSSYSIRDDGEETKRAFNHMQNPTEYDEQIERIIAKLKDARLCDPDFKVFGASSHQYGIGPPIDLDQVTQTEKRYRISLPNDYVAFLTKIGNGSPQGTKAAAGPSYGIFSFEEELPAAGGIDTLRLPPIIHPKLTDEEWKSEARDFDIKDEQKRLFAGLLLVGDQGCDCYQALVVSGPDKGRIVNLALSGSKPRFAFEANFLDWYERWLDEIISGILLKKNDSWFGYTMGGDDPFLMSVFDRASNNVAKTEALKGLTKLLDIEPSTAIRLDKLCLDQNKSIRDAALDALTKFEIGRAQKHLVRLASGDDSDKLSASLAVFRYSRSSCAIIADQLLQHLHSVKDQWTFQVVMYVLDEAGADFADQIVPFASHPETKFRTSAFYFLGKAADKNRHVSTFLRGLKDEETSVVHATLQALEGVTDERLLPAYRLLAERYLSDEMFVRTNLQHRLAEFGFESIVIFEKKGSSQ